LIDLDSPVESVLGVAKGKKAQSRYQGITERLGLRTVGDLLGHFPRRYLETGSLSSLDELKEGQLLTVVGEISSSHSRTYRDRRTGRMAYRQEVVLRTEGPSLQMTFFAQQSHVGRFNEQRFSPGRRGIFMGKVGTFRGEWQLTNPQMVLFGADGEASEDLAALSLETIGPLYPLYPATKDVE
jgi:ATP-dependent DNA helicase RecG